MSEINFPLTQVFLRGVVLLDNPALNKSTAFT